MRILMNSDVYFPRVNGVSTSIQTFRPEPQSLGHEITLVVPDYPVTHANDSGIKRVPVRTVPFDPEERLMKSAAVPALTKALQSEHYDLVHVQTHFVAHYLGVKLAKRVGVTCIEPYHTFFE